MPNNIPKARMEYS